MTTIRADGPPDFLRAIGPKDRSWRRILLFVFLTSLITFAGWFVAYLIDLRVSGYLRALDMADFRQRLAHHLSAIAPVRPALFGSAYNALVLAGLSNVLILLLAAKVFGRKVRSFITAAPRFRWWLWGAGLAGVVALRAGGDVAFSWVTQRPLELNGLFNPQMTSLAGVAAVLFIVECLVVGAVEEVFCRGWLMQQIAAVSGNTWIALLLQAILFAAFHRDFQPYSMAMRIALGLALGWAALRLGGLEFGMGMHTGFNIVAFGLVWSSSFKPGDPGQFPTQPTVWDLPVVLTTLVCTIGFVEVIRRCYGRPLILRRQEALG